MRPILWLREEAHSVEYCQPNATEEGFEIAGTVVLLMDRLPAVVTYRVTCDRNWRTRGVAVEQNLAGTRRALSLTVSGEGTWHQGAVEVPFASGLADVDLEITPATNTLPINRLQLRDGESRAVTAVWVRFPSLTVEPLEQSYTRLAGNRYRYRSLTGFEALLEVDESGFVTRYGDLWWRVS